MPGARPLQSARQRNARDPIGPRPAGTHPAHVEIEILEHRLLVSDARIHQAHPRQALEGHAGRPARRPGPRLRGGRGRRRSRGRGARCPPVAHCLRRARILRRQPIPPPRGIALQIEIEAVDFDAADHEAACEQRQEPHAQGRALDGRERRGAEARRVAEARASELEPDPGKHRELEVSLEFEIAPRRALHGGGDARFVVVRIDAEAHGEKRDGRHQNDRADHDEDHSSRAHARASVLALPSER